MTNSKALWACCGLSAVAATAQQNPGPGEVVLSSAFYRPPSRIGFEAETKLVEVGAVVRDPRGQSVAGLTKDDFEILDEGHRRQITAFRVETAAPLSEVAPVTGAAAPLGKTPAVATSPATVSQRYIALIFDDLSMDHGQLVSAQAAALGFVKEGLREGDRAGLFTMSGEQNVPFTADASKLADAIGKIRLNLRTPGGVECPGISPYEAYLIANRISLETFNVKVQEMGRCQYGGGSVLNMTSWDSPAQGRNPGAAQTTMALAAKVMSQASVRWEQVVLQSRTDLITIGQVVDLLAHADASRTILLASSGFLSATLEPELDEVIRRALHAGVVINSIDAKGLFTTSMSASEGGGQRYDVRSLKNMQSIALMSKEAANDAVAELAFNTGGLFFHNRNDLGAGFNELGVRPEVSYRMAFTPEEAPNGNYHHLKVRLKAPGHNTVQARLGYMAIKPLAVKPPEERHIDTVIAGNDVLEDLPGDLSAHQIQTQSGEPGLMTVFHVDIRQLRFTEQAGERRQKLSLIALLTDADDNFVAGKEGSVTLTLKQGTFDANAAAGMNFTLTLQAPRGLYRLRTAMSEGIEGKVTARTLPVDIR